MTMTDRELLERAAKAAGIPVQLSTFLGHECLAHAGSVTPWMPLDDNGDALRLAVMLSISIDPCRTPNANSRGTTVAGGNYVGVCEHWDDDPCAATRRAIVRRAAAMAKED